MIDFTVNEKFLSSKEGRRKFREVSKKFELIKPKSGTEISRQALESAMRQYREKRMPARKWLVYWSELGNAK